MFVHRSNSLRASIIIPTLNERENIDIILHEVFEEVDPEILLEVLVADGGSTDGTVERVREWEATFPVRLIPGSGAGGLAGDVLAAARAATGDVVVVMDADLSHPPTAIRALARAVASEDADMAVASRYTPGGATVGWSWHRRILSRLGGLLAWPLTDLSDPMSGFFAVRRERLLAVPADAAGFKIGLEVIAHGGGQLRVSEIPIVFTDRVHGESKIGYGQMITYLRRLLVLAGGAVSAGGTLRFAAVGLLGMLVDLIAFQFMFRMGVPLLAAHIGSFAIATVSNYVLNARWAFAAGPDPGDQDARKADYSKFLTVCLLALAVRSGVLFSSVGIFGLPPNFAIVLAIGVASVINYLGSAFFVFPSTDANLPSDIRWRIAAIGVVSYALVLRLLFLGLVDLIPQEAYYWNYAQHPDLGYLDHPPMVAWLILTTTSVFGDNEFGVRFASWIGWFATAFFSFGLARQLFGKSAAFVSLLLVGVLPFYFATGFLMTPDAPLVATWAGTLYFLARALLGDRRNAWWGVGTCLGLGMLSKYTIVLLGPAILLFMLVDRGACKWLRRPEPYLAALLALIIFSPAIYWNVQNGLASFTFQSFRRINAGFDFSLQTLFGYALVLLTPPGLVAACAALWTQHGRAGSRWANENDRRIARFILIFTLIPLSVFVAFSLTRGVKLNWTGPLWLAVLPAVSAAIVSVADGALGFERIMRQLWVRTTEISLVLFGLGLNYLAFGIPALGYISSLRTAPTAWSEFGRDAASLAQQVKRDTGAEPMMIGLDTYNIASQLAFYGKDDGDTEEESVGRGVLGLPSLMYGYWHRAEPLYGRPAIMFALKRNQVEDPDLSKSFDRLSAPMEREVMKDGYPAMRFYYRIGYGFRERTTETEKMEIGAVRGILRR